MNAVKLHYSEKIVRGAVKAFWWRTTGWSYFSALILVGGCLTYLVATGQRAWWVGAMGTIVVSGALIAIAVFVIHFRGSMARLRRMTIPEATLELGEENFRITSDAGMSETPWTSVVDLWQFPDFWLLFFSRAQFITLPTADLPPEARQVIVAKVRPRKT